MTADRDWQPVGSQAVPDGAPGDEPIQQRELGVEASPGSVGASLAKRGRLVTDLRGGAQVGIPAAPRERRGIGLRDPRVAAFREVAEMRDPGRSDRLASAKPVLVNNP
jgi:hypothetical protein